MLGQVNFQFQSLLFRHAAPRTFTKVLVVVLAPFKEQGPFIHPDSLLPAHDLDQILVHRQILIEALQNFLVIINYKKNKVVHSQQIMSGSELQQFKQLHLPAIIESVGHQGKVQKALSPIQMSAFQCLSLLRTMSWCILMIPGTQTLS